MSIGLDEVLHVAKLAELAVKESEFRRLVEQREDVEAPMPLARPPAAMAPEFADGFFLVPRHGAMEDQ